MGRISAGSAVRVSTSSILFSGETVRGSVNPGTATQIAAQLNPEAPPVIEDSRVVEASAVATTFFQFKSETTDEMRQYFQDNKYVSREWLYSYDALGVDLVSTLT